MNRKCKFKVGDIVKPNKKADGEYSITTRARMEEGVVAQIDPAGIMTVKITKWVNNNAASICKYWPVDPECFDLVSASSNQELHMTTDGKTTHAILKENGKVVKRARADCDPRDKFDFETGARLAIDRVFGKEEAEKKEQTYKFNIGDHVVVKDKKAAFPFFKDFVEQYDKDTQLLFAYGHCPKQGGSYTVIKRGFHPETKAPLYLIQPSSNTLDFGELYLIGERGLASLYDCCKYL